MAIRISTHDFKQRMIEIFRLSHLQNIDIEIVCDKNGMVKINHVFLMDIDHADQILAMYKEEKDGEEIRTVLVGRGRVE